ncbi:hypothetical protein [Tenacibaculum sp. M341]|uniref:hypothetical protein n=1 Tax=Tenacibaculum sp. M341 TaxID=2530339 RepID=UPI001043EBAC|nr:hypothetical protein [Tenacibaculum sp. M341]TCI85390.1 hypothetical protein EYW44_16695 [Tenacibaculum sp. M341]
MRNLKLLLMIIVLFVITTSCTDNTDELITTTQNTDIPLDQLNEASTLYIPTGGSDKGGTGKE